jgi:CarD family transcriptional regulator
MKSKFNVGDKAVYPAHGVGEIVGMQIKEIAGNKISFYILKILNSDLTVLIPINNINSVGLREIIHKNEVRAIYKILQDKAPSIDIQTWNRRYREYLRKIRTGNPTEIAQVLRDLYHLKSDKILSFGEKRMLDSAESLLIKEISLAKNTSEDKIKKELSKFFKKPVKEVEHLSELDKHDEVESEEDDGKEKPKDKIPTSSSKKKVKNSVVYER